MRSDQFIGSYIFELGESNEGWQFMIAVIKNLPLGGRFFITALLIRFRQFVPIHQTTHPAVA